MCLDTKPPLRKTCIIVRVFANPPHVKTPEQRTYLSSDGAFDAPTLDLGTSLARCAEGRLVTAGFSVIPFVVQPRYQLRASDWTKNFAKIAACGLTNTRVRRKVIRSDDLQCMCICVKGRKGYAGISNSGVETSHRAEFEYVEEVVLQRSVIFKDSQI